MIDQDSQHLDRFREGVARHAASVRRTTPTSFETDLLDAVVDPVVGAPLPFDDLTLPDSVPAVSTTADLSAARTGVSAASLGVADYGSVVLESDPEGSDPVSLFPERHVVVLRAADVVPRLADALDELGPRIRDERSSAVFATGPSATADMGELVYGAHGPREVTVLLVEAGGEP
jgi:L-lactate dehydrogenase complex protein LldG